MYRSAVSIENIGGSQNFSCEIIRVIVPFISSIASLQDSIVKILKVKPRIEYYSRGEYNLAVLYGNYRPKYLSVLISCAFYLLGC